MSTNKFLYFDNGYIRKSKIIFLCKDNLIFSNDKCVRIHTSGDHKLSKYIECYKTALEADKRFEQVKKELIC